MPCMAAALPMGTTTQDMQSHTHLGAIRDRLVHERRDALSQAGHAHGAAVHGLPPARAPGAAAARLP